MAFDKILSKANLLMSSAEAKPNFSEAKQNLLLNDLENMAAKGKKLNNSWKNFISLEDKDPALTVSKTLSFGERVRPYIEGAGDPSIASLLTPIVKLYKVIRDDNERIVKELEIPLFSSTENRILAPGQVLSEVGFDNLSFEMSDQTAFGAARLVKVGLSLVFNDISGLTKSTSAKVVNPPDGEPDEETFQYIDLIRRTNGRMNPADLVAGDQYLSYSLRMEIGIQHPSESAINSITSGNKWSDEEVREIIAAAVEANNLVMLLELEDYDLSFTEEGITTLQLSYYSWIERQSELIDYDIFSNVKQTSSKEVKEKMQEAYAKTDRDEVLEEINKIKTKLRGKEAALKNAEVRRATAQAQLEAMNQPRKDKDGKIIPQTYDQMQTAIRLQQEVRNMTSYTATLRAQIGTEGGDGVLEFLSDTLQEDLRSEQEKLLEIERGLQSERDKYLFGNKVSKYSRLLNWLVENNKIYHTQVDEDRLLMYSKDYIKFLSQAFVEEGESSLSGAEIGPDQISFVLAQARTQASAIKVKKSSTESSKSLSQSILEQQDAITKLFKDSTRQEQEKTIFEQGLNSFLKPKNAANSRTGKVLLHFFYLGDLIDAALSIGDNTPTKMNEDKIGIIMGNFTYVNMFNEKNNLQTSEDNSKQATSINFADVPISLDFFSEFWAATIVDKNLDKLPFFNLLQGVIQQLVIPALNRAVAGIPNQHPISAKLSTLPSTNKISGAAFYATNEVTKIKSFIDAANFTHKSRFSFTNPLIQDFVKGAMQFTSHDRNRIESTDIWNYFIVHGAQNKLITGLGNSVQEDFNSGVYHFVFGGGSPNPDDPRRGRTDIVEQINFTKVKQKGQREMMVDRYMNSSGVDRNIELWNQFDVDMDLLGNNLFFPGKFIYIEPRAGNLAGSDAIARELGLGGYYLVTGVSHEISGEAFFWTTKIKAAWQSGPRASSGSNIKDSAADKLSYEEVATLLYEAEQEKYSISSQPNSDMSVGTLKDLTGTKGKGKL